jgi:hypothetical protein
VAAGFVSDFPNDGLAFGDLSAFNGNVFAARGSTVLLRNPAATPKWGVVFNVSGAALFNATWGSAATPDLYAVGADQPCGTNCGEIEHKVGGLPPATQNITGCTVFYDVWGEAVTGGGFNVYAVGSFGTLANTANTDTWTPLATPTSAHLFGVRGADGEVYIVGGAGTILHLVE